MRLEQRDSVDPVQLAAQALGRAIQTSPEWREFESAQRAAQNDPELAMQRERLRRLSERWNRARAEGRGLPGKEALESASLQESVRGHELFRREQAAAGALVALLQEANRTISQLLEIDFAATAAPRGGCCG